MDNQEAIRLIRNLPTMCEFTDAYGDPIDSDAYYEAVDMAISALDKQIPSGAESSSSLIDRQEVIRIIDRNGILGQGLLNDILDHIVERIMQLPPAHLVITCDGCRFVGTYDTDFPCRCCIRREKDYYEKE